MQVCAVVNGVSLLEQVHTQESVCKITTTVNKNFKFVLHHRLVVHRFSLVVIEVVKLGFVIIIGTVISVQKAALVAVLYVLCLTVSVVVYV